MRDTSTTDLDVRLDVDPDLRMLSDPRSSLVGVRLVSRLFDFVRVTEVCSTASAKHTGKSTSALISEEKWGEITNDVPVQGVKQCDRIHVARDHDIRVTYATKCISSWPFSAVRNNVNSLSSLLPQ